MSVLIKGMEMPKPKSTDMATVYAAYVLVSPNGYATIVVENEDGLDSTEYLLVPVPPHGRLIDADAYEKLLRGLGNRDYRREAGTLQDAIKFLHPHYAPTIIPAEEGE